MTPSRNPTDRPRRLHFITFCGAMVLASTLSCGRSDPTVPSESTVSVTPASTLLVGVGEMQPLLAQVTDASGATLPVSVEWSTDNPAVATVTPGVFWGDEIRKDPRFDALLVRIGHPTRVGASVGPRVGV